MAKYRLYTGPTIVKQTADKLRQAGLNVTIEGTEHVHFETEAVDTQAVIKQVRGILGSDWGVRDVQKIGMIHSDSELSQKMEPATRAPQAGPSNTELVENSHSENGASPTIDGEMKSPERANVNAIREALETQVEMEVGKPIEQKQQEVAVQEEVQDAALAQGGASGVQEVSAKPGTQIIINVGSKTAASAGLKKKLNPARFNGISGKMSAIVGYILGEKYTDPSITEMAITSDGIVMAARSGDLGMNDMIGSYNDFMSNWKRLCQTAGLDENEMKEATALVKRIPNYSTWAENVKSSAKRAAEPGNPNEGEPGDKLKEICPKCHVREGDECQCPKTAAVKVAYVSHCPGHRNSKGEKAEWCVRQHNTDKILTSYGTEQAAKDGLRNMESHKGSASKDAAMRVRVSEGSGLDSGKEGVIIPWTDPKAQAMASEYPFVGGRTPQSMGWVAIALDGGDLTTVPKSRTLQIKRSTEAEGIGGEDQGKITSGQGGGMFGGTDLEGPQFHVGFTLKGLERTASFTTLAEADKFITTASAKFGKMAGDWSMKCPRCGGTAHKDKPQDNYKCDCGWNSKEGSAKKAKQMKQVEPDSQFVEAMVNAVLVDFAARAMEMDFPLARLISIIKTKIKVKKSKGNATISVYVPENDTEYVMQLPADQAQGGNWKFNPGMDPATGLPKSSSAIDPARRALVLELLKNNNLTTGEIEKRLGGGKYTVMAYPILQQLAKEGLVKHKQMRWYLKTASDPNHLPDWVYEKSGWKNIGGHWTDVNGHGISPELLAEAEGQSGSVLKDVPWQRSGAVAEHGVPYQCFILDEYGDTSEATNAETPAQAMNFFQARGINPADLKVIEKQDKTVYTYKTGNATGPLDPRKAPQKPKSRFEDLDPETSMPPSSLSDVELLRGTPSWGRKKDLFEYPSEAKKMGSANIRVKLGRMPLPRSGTPEAAELKIAIQTLKMPAPMQGVMGGPGPEHALKVLERYGLRWDDADYMAGGKGVKQAGEGMAKTDEQLEKEAGFNFFFPGQVLKEFYPEIQHEIVDYPNATNQPMSGAGAPEIVGDGGHELEGMLDSALSTGVVEMIQLPADIGEMEPMAMAAADYSSTSPAGGMGIGRDGKSQVLEGVPLRKENDIRGPMFTDEFYGQYAEVPGAAMAVASKTAADGGESRQFSMFLKKVCGEIAATMVAAFKVTSRPLLDKVPGVGEIQLDQIEQGSSALPMGATVQGGRVKYLLDKLNDSEVKAAINEAWAQGAVWHDGPSGGFVYEVFVRPETIDTESMVMKYKFVAGTRE